MSQRWSPSTSSISFARTNSVVVGVGAVLVLAAYTVLNWFRPGGNAFFDGSGTHSTFADLHSLLESTKRQVAADGISSHVSFGAAEPYFSWLGWVLFVLALAAGALAVSSLGQQRFVYRWLGAVVAAAALGVTLTALNLVVFEGNAVGNANAPGYADFVGHSSLGAWAALLGYLLVLIGSLMPQP